MNTLNTLGVEKPDYSNWVSTRFVYIPAGLGLLCVGLSIVAPVLIVVAVLFFLMSLYFLYARYRFSPAGGNVQAQVQDLVLAHLDWDGQGKALDVGCGNGPLTIKLAHKYPNAQVTGIDAWGEMWEYSRRVCDRNAMIEEVAAQTTFQKATASALPFADESFDAAVSNLVFHEVRDAKDKRELIREALRVVKKGGRFAFQDLFQWKSIYGETDELVATLKSWGITKVAFIKTSDAAFIPTALKLPFMVGTIGVLYGEK
ncbi:MAG: class I SAM-dependent methyltransferase [Chloroflexi bacterium]|nr:class I SAM-dependent methyltransferase [Chloroflexota bacterium]